MLVREVTVLSVLDIKFVLQYNVNRPFLGICNPLMRKLRSVDQGRLKLGAYTIVGGYVTCGDG